MDAICVLFLLSSPLRSSFVSVVFDFSASLNNVAPVSSILFTVDEMLMEKCRLLFVVIFCVVFLYSPHRLSFVSVVFDFNASLNDVAPVYPISFSVDANKRKIHKTVFEKTVHPMICCES